MVIPNSTYCVPSIATNSAALALSIVRQLQKAGHEAYWVGGCVRDRLLEIEAKDYDIATSARPDEVVALFPGASLVGASFGVVVVTQEDVAFEVATFRSDGEYIDHRHPQEVSFGTVEQDARRRDFTINALFYDPVADRLLDFAGGRQDIQDRLLRCVGNPRARFSEDALRLMRAVRFAVRFCMTIEPETWTALQEKAPLIEAISPERVRDELIMMLTQPRPGETLRLLSKAGLLKRILPEIEAMRGVEQPPEFHPEGDVFVHTCLVMDALGQVEENDAEKTAAASEEVCAAFAPPSPTLAMAALLHDVGKPITYQRGPDRIRFPEHAPAGARMAEEICRRLRFSNRESEDIVALVARHMTFIDVQEMRTSKLKRFMAAPMFTEDMALHRADCLASHRNLDNLVFCRRKLAEFVFEAKSQKILPPPLITGDDLIALGYFPGPIFRTILDMVGDAQMEGAVATRESALAYVRDHFPR
ncbi:MAG: CCA tRNA nucleotidyltransferase [Candidatus Sumerlaeota bacterium]|nr:CCA tRNA nucleotidyltransferase [Candidatus Sumerlaeota bacterium]